jgi:hypothetical protein
MGLTNKKETKQPKVTGEESRSLVIYQYLCRNQIEKRGIPCDLHSNKINLSGLQLNTETIKLDLVFNKCMGSLEIEYEITERIPNLTEIRIDTSNTWIKFLSIKING